MSTMNPLLLRPLLYSLEVWREIAQRCNAGRSRVEPHCVYSIARTSNLSVLHVAPAIDLTTLVDGLKGRNRRVMNAQIGIMRPYRKAPIPIRDEVGVVIGDAQVIDDFPFARVEQVLDGNPFWPSKC